MPRARTASKKQRFEATLYPDSPGSSVLKLDVPFSTEEVFGTRARVPVRGASSRSITTLAMSPAFTCAPSRISRLTTIMWHLPPMGQMELR